jgi:ketosteroid isomerase-like protein
MERRDAKGMIVHMRSDVVFEPASTEVVTRRPYQGHDGIRAWLADIARDWEEFEVTLTELRSNPPYHVTMCRVYARTGGYVTDSPIGVTWRVEDGLITWGKSFRDRAAALRAAGLD